MSRLSLVLEYQSLFRNFRLLDSGRNREVDSAEGLKLGDRVFSPGEPSLQSLLRMDQRVVIDARDCVVNPTSGLVGDDNFFTQVLVYRRDFPKIQSEKELSYLLANTPDIGVNILALDFEGCFCMESPKNKRIWDSFIAVRNESFGGGNGYVGLKAARDEEYVRELYNSMLGGWLQHLKGKESNVYIGDVSFESPDFIRSELKKFEGNWISQTL